MIGQNTLRDYITELITNNHYPHFAILTGIPGSGRKTVSKWIASKLGATFTVVRTGVDDVRQLISTAYKSTLPVVYCIADADTMSSAARNALLKLTEEPPEHAYIIMTFTDESSIMATLKSRAMVFEMDYYNEYQIAEYYNSRYSGDDIHIIRDICSVPGDVDMIAGKAQEFHDFIEKVVDNIADVSISNAFKIADAVKLKDTDENKWDLRLFWTAFQRSCLHRGFNSGRVKNALYLSWITVTGHYVNDLRIKGLNKAAAFAMWVVDIQGCPWN